MAGDRVHSHCPPALTALATDIAALTGADPATLAEELAADSPAAGTVLRQVLLRCFDGQGLGTWVVMVDQFAELVTLCIDDQQRRTFIELLSPCGISLLGGTHVG